MTFTPQVLTQTDNNNSVEGSSLTSFNGLSTVTTGFNTLILTVISDIDSSAGGIQIKFSDDNSTWITPYTDTYFTSNVFTDASNVFTKTYLIIKKYYKISYTTSSANFTITSRLSTNLDSSITQNTSISVFDNNIENTLDAFGKLRVSNPTTLLDIRFPGKNSGNSLFLKNNLQICSDSSGNYTGIYAGSKLSIDACETSRYSKSSTSWNIDKMNGTGSSGLKLDFKMTQLFVIDMEWLGVGRVRFGFYAYGRIQYCHQVTNINSLVKPYTSSINLPICFSIHNNVNTSLSANSFTQICSTVISEGGYTPVGRPFAVSTGNSTIDVSGNIEEPLIFLTGNRANKNYLNQNIVPTITSMICSTNNDLILFKLVLFLAGDYTGTIPTWINVDASYSVANYAINPPEYNSTNGIIIDQGYFYGKGTNTISSLGEVFSTQLLQLTSDIKNNSDILALTATYINNNNSSTKLSATIGWQEIY